MIHYLQIYRPRFQNLFSKIFFITSFLLFSTITINDTCDAKDNVHFKYLHKAQSNYSLIMTINTYNENTST